MKKNVICKNCQKQTEHEEGDHCQHCGHCPTEMKMTATWEGRPIEDLSREELIEALNWCASEIQRLMKEKEHERGFIFENFVRKSP